MVAVSKICVDFRKEAVIFMADSAKLCLRNENAFFGRCFPPKKAKGERLL